MKLRRTNNAIDIVIITGTYFRFYHPENFLSILLNRLKKNWQFFKLYNVDTSQRFVAFTDIP